MEKSHEENMVSIFADTAHKLAEGDKEVESSIKSQLSTIYYNSQDNKNIFYQAMLIMVFSYYETSANLICQELSISKNAKKDTISSIFEKRHIYIPDYIKPSKRLLYEYVRELRNFTVHNNSIKPTTKQELVIKRLVKVFPEIKYENNEISISGHKCISYFLMKEYDVLRYICVALGYC